MKSLKEWLDRKPKGPAPRKPIARTSRLQRGGPVKPISDTRQMEGRLYRTKRTKFLTDRPRCEAALPGCGGPSCDVHHRAGRYGGNYLNEATWTAVCRPCHDWIHSHPKDARERGLLV